MSLPTKLGIGTLALGSAVGAGYVGVSYFSKEDKKEELNNTLQQGTAISELVNKEYEYILLNTSKDPNNKDKERWNKNWETYKTDNTSANTNVLNLEGWDKSNPGDSAEALKKRCGELATEKVPGSTDGLYQNVTKYCGREVTIEDEATKNGATILVTTPSGKDSKIWTKRHTNVANLKNDLDKLGVKESNPTEENIRNGCNTAKAKNKKEKDVNYQEILDAYLKICIKQQGDPE